MQRGAPDHVSNAARDLLANEAVQAVRERMRTLAEVRIRGASTNDAEQCRGAVAAYQAYAAVWAQLEQLPNEQEMREMKRTLEVV